jgi:hypothetical protein
MEAGITSSGDPFPARRVHASFWSPRSQPMTDEQPTRWVHGSDEDLVACIAHALRHEGKPATRQADQLIAQAAAARILEAMRRAYVITPKAPQPLTRWAATDEGGGRAGIRGRG